MVRKIISLLFLSAVAVCFSSCGVNCVYPTLHYVRTSDDVRGRVYDLKTGKPIQNVRISFEGKKNRYASTDRSGYYHIGSVHELGFLMCNFDGQSSAHFYYELNVEHDDYLSQHFRTHYGSSNERFLFSGSERGRSVVLELPEDYPKTQLPTCLTMSEFRKIRLQVADWERQRKRTDKSPENFNPENKRYLVDIYLVPKTCDGETPK